MKESRRIKILKKSIAVATLAAMVFTLAPAAFGSIEVDAASKSAPGQVRSIKAESNGHSVVKVSWSRVSKKTKGYTIYRNGKSVDSVDKDKLSFKDKELKAKTTYNYYVKAYNIKKVTKWYNTKTKKWQTKKPAKKYRGKSKVVKQKVYGKASSTVTIKTPAKKTSNKTTLSLDDIPVPSIKVIGAGKRGATSDLEVKISLKKGSKEVGGEELAAFVKGIKGITWTCKDNGITMTYTDDTVTITVPVEFNGNTITIVPTIIDSTGYEWKFKGFTIEIQD